MILEQPNQLLMRNSNPNQIIYTKDSPSEADKQMLRDLQTIQVQMRHTDNILLDVNRTGAIHTVQYEIPLLRKEIIESIKKEDSKPELYGEKSNKDFVQEKFDTKSLSNESKAGFTQEKFDKKILSNESKADSISKDANTEVIRTVNEIIKPNENQKTKENLFKKVNTQIKNNIEKTEKEIRNIDGRKTVYRNSNKNVSSTVNEIIPELQESESKQNNFDYFDMNKAQKNTDSTALHTLTMDKGRSLPTISDTDTTIENSFKNIEDSRNDKKDEDKTKKSIKDTIKDITDNISKIVSPDFFVDKPTLNIENQDKFKNLNILHNKIYLSTKDGYLSSKSKTIESILRSGVDFLGGHFTAALIWYDENDISQSALQMEDNKNSLIKSEDDWTKNQLNIYGFAVRLQDIDIPAKQNDSFQLKTTNYVVEKIKSLKSIEKQASFSFRLDKNLEWLRFFNDLSGNKATICRYKENQDLSDTWQNRIGFFPKSFYFGKNSVSKRLCLIISSDAFENTIDDKQTFKRDKFQYAFEDIKFLGSSDIEYSNTSADPDNIRVDFIFKRLRKVSV